IFHCSRLLPGAFCGRLHIEDSRGPEGDLRVTAGSSRGCGKESASSARFVILAVVVLVAVYCSRSFQKELFGPMMVVALAFGTPPSVQVLVKGDRERPMMLANRF